MKDLKKLYGVTLRSSMIVSLVLVIGAFVFIPEIKVTPYEPRVDGGVIVDPGFLPIDKPDRPKPVSPRRPQPPVNDMGVDTDSAQITINPTDINDYIPLPTDYNPVEIMPYHSVQVQPKPVYTPAPVYPPILVKAGIEGTCVLEAVIDTSGAVMSVVVFHSSGNTMLDEEAIKAFKTYRFTPGYARDRAVFVRVKMPIAFKLK